MGVMIQNVRFRLGLTVLFSALPSFAQQTTATLVGTASDASGAVLRIELEVWQTPRQTENLIVGSVIDRSAPRSRGPGLLDHDVSKRLSRPGHIGSGYNGNRHHPRPDQIGHGNLPGALRLPGITNFDFSAIKSVRFKETRSFEFRTEIFNLFNNFNPDPGPVDRNLNSATFGSIGGGVQGITTRVIYF